MADFAEVVLAQPEEDRTVELRLPADVVVLAGVELLPVLVDPLLVSLVARAGDHLAAVPVLGLAANVIAALEDQDAEARRGEAVGERAAACAAADDDHVVVVVHGVPPQTRAIGDVQAPVAPRSLGCVRTKANSCTPSAASALVSRFSTTKTPWRTFRVRGTSNGRAGSS